MKKLTEKKCDDSNVDIKDQLGRLILDAIDNHRKFLSDHCPLEETIVDFDWEDTLHVKISISKL